ncbi:hypothetical protein DWY46_16430 [Blautia obeum]|uniref:DUF6273 domain-containing protein n=1 Tax=Blautia obeum TaxID=40520 RepID=A0A412ELS8_9FIRM|nr:DUF6273 domain-containing protein [Blautia obeum]RGR45773.1 hypothetical protein DWY46_16430 [Blautia obeum]
MGKLLTNEVGLQMLAEMKRQTAISEAAARDQIAALASQMSSIAKIVRDGYGSVLMDIGDQLNIDWTDGSKSYNVPHDIVHFADVDLKNGDKVPGMYIQWHFCSPFGVQFDAAEAFYYAETELAAGTYNIIVGDNWGTNCKKNEQYQFTLSKPVPKGGQIAGFYSMPDKAPSEWTVQTFTDAKSTTPIETVKPTAGSNGTNLGTLSFTGDGKLNSLQRVAYGYNRWSQSAIRQYLNSAKAAGQWWEPQHKWDRPPAELASKPGFLSGYSDDFLNAIKPVRVRTALNTVTDAAVGTYEDTYDKIFLASLEQEFITPQASGVEGEAWDYWKQAVERSTPTPWYKTFAEGGHPITYGIDGKTSAQNVRLRSANRGYANNTWFVYASGNVSNYGAVSSHRFAPACVIC